MARKFPQVLDWWDHAWFLHVEGFHEARLGMEEVELRAQSVEKLVALVDQSAGEREKSPKSNVQSRDNPDLGHRT